VSLNPRAIATLGVGFGAISIAYLGLWPTGITPPEPPPAQGSWSGVTISAPIRAHGHVDDRDLLEIIPIVVEVMNGRRY
jgi:hypothetical protein